MWIKDNRNALTSDLVLSYWQVNPCSQRQVGFLESLL